MQHSPHYSIILEDLRARHDKGSLTVEQLAAELGCSERTIMRSAATGSFPAPMRPAGTGRGYTARWPLPIVASYMAGVWTLTPTPPAPSNQIQPQMMDASTPKRRGRPRKGEVRP